MVSGNDVDEKEDADPEQEKFEAARD